MLTMIETPRQGTLLSMTEEAKLILEVSGDAIHFNRLRHHKPFITNRLLPKYSITLLSAK
jgi:hypothetical protein